MTKPDSIAAWKVIDLMVRILTPILFGVMIFMGQKVMDLNDRVVQMESNRFTSKDGIELREMLHKEFTAIRGDIASLMINMPSEFPPLWHVKRVDSLEKRLEKLERK